MNTAPIDADTAIIAQELIRRFNVTPIKNVLLINPPAVPGDVFDAEAAKKKRYSGFIPYGLLVLATCLRRAGFTVSILDLNFVVLDKVRRRKTFNFDQIWKYALHDAVDAFRPDVIGVTCMFTMTHPIFVEVVREAKAYAERPLIIGGVHVTNDTERILREIGVADAAGTHEADVSFTKLLQFLNCPEDPPSLAQLAMIIDGEYKVARAMHLPGSEELSVIASFDLVNTRRYSSVGVFGSFVSLLPKKRISVVLANRGCRAQCTFCSVRYFNGPGVRSRSIKSVADEIEMLYHEYGIRHVVWLDDDLFYGDPVGLFNEIMRRNLKGFTWDASNGVIAAVLTPEIAAAASESGCIGLFFGFESGNAKMLREMKKPGTIEQYLKAAQIIKQYPRIFTRAFLMIGFPHETFGMMMDTMNFARDIAMDWYNITILQPLPSTPIYKSMIEEGLLEDQIENREVKFQIGPYGKQSELEKRERAKVSCSFKEELEKFDPDAVPPKEKLKHIWFWMNFKVNYERMNFVSDPVKVRMLQMFLRDICDRVTNEHALANLSSAVLEYKAGELTEARKRTEVVERALAQSAYWRDKFDAFDLYPELVSIKRALVA